jgi:hypothetical protein
VIGAGIAAALIAAAANALAVVLQAAEARHAPDSEAMRASLLRRLARRPRWLAGTGLMILAGVLQVVALSFAAISLVEPMLSTSQLVLLAIARWKLREPVGRSEVLGALAILAGLAAIASVAPPHVDIEASAGQLAPPMALIGGLALAGFLFGRWRRRARLMLVLGAGLAYAWVDFVIKLLSNAASSGDWALAAAWVVALVAVGAVAFLEETTALHHRPAVTVAPVIGALKVPLPVLMALWAGLEQWGGSARDVAFLLAGLALTAAGAATLGRSEVVARLSRAERPRDEQDGEPERERAQPGRCMVGQR